MKPWGTFGNSGFGEMYWFWRDVFTVLVNLMLTSFC